MTSLPDVTTEQPQAEKELSVVEAACDVSPSVPKPSVGQRSIEFICSVFFILSNGFAYAIYMVISLGIFALVLGFVNGLMAAFGAIYMLTGNGILRSAHLAHYTDNASAAAIGATGGSVTSIIFSVFMQITGTGEAPFFQSLGGIILFSTLTGAIGCAILMHNDVDLGPIDVLHATRAGAVGGAVLWFAMAVALLPILLVLSSILIFILSALRTGAKWISARWKETWNGGISQSLTCCCYGTCGKDLEIGEEVEERMSEINNFS